ncbi:glycosyltransferase family 2 protein [Rufibacter sediminis]|uniref:Glycosyltransferase family 2 protein n=1 Tax=Rufibacter sediminis TaxID=2762756 RepID=A0ABR6VLI5_9BACT|nr:glycosyltransferase family 2 protein [Rufibacter sediminis]MBC3538111.1 glycosyltransferase family 2 protein [Rufibacter sediminis]
MTEAAFALPWVSIILLNYKGHQDTMECLESLFKLDYERFSIVVVDNHSPDHSLDYIQQWLQEYEQEKVKEKLVVTEGRFHFHFDHVKEETLATHSRVKALVTTIQGAENLGFAGGNNIGIRFAQRTFSPDFVWVLNNDTVVAPDSLSHLVRKAQLDLQFGHRIGIWGSKLLYYHQPDTIQAIGGKLNLTTFTTRHIDEGQKDSPSAYLENPNQDYVIGASLFVSRAFLDEVGVLSEDYFLYFEELDWVKRGQKLGYALGYVPESRVYHKEGTSIGSSSAGKKKSDLADYHGIRSKIIFFQKFYPEKKLHLYAVLLVSVFLRLGRFQLKRAFQILKLMGRTP